MPFTFNFGGFNPGNFGGFNGAEGQGDAGYTPPRPKKARKPRKPIGNAFTRTLINLAVTLVFGLVYFYVELPAINLHAEEFYVFAFLLCAVYCVCAVLTSGFQGEGVRGYVHFVKKQCTVPFLAFILLIAAIAIARTAGLLVYLPVMIVISIFTGLFTGLCAQFLVKRGGTLWKTFFK